MSSGGCGAPGGTRTPNPRIRSAMLYPLSYGRSASGNLLASQTVYHRRRALASARQRCARCEGAHAGCAPLRRRLVGRAAILLAALAVALG